jgi:ABC-type branched-subunit amino acid transport system substrate-binding protein
VAGLLALGLVATACGSSSKPAATTAGSGATTTPPTTGATSTADETTGLTATTINIGEIADVSGPVPGLFQGAVYGTQAWAAYVNANGGIDGRKVNLVLKDSALSCTTDTTDLSSIVNSVFAAVGSYAIFDGCGLATLKAHPDFPNLQGAIITPSLYALPNTFAPLPLPTGGLTTTYQYVKDKFPADITHTAGLYGAAATASYEEEANAAKSIGFKYVYMRGLGNTETNFTADILRMKADGIKVVDMQVADAIEVADFLQEAQQQDFHPDAVVSAVSYDPGFFQVLGSADASSLVIGLETNLYLDPNSPIANIRSLNKYLDIVHPGAKPTLYAVEAFAAGLMFQQAMAAVGPNPTRSALIAATAKITSFDAGGMVGPTNPGGKVPGVCEVIAGVKDGAFVRIDPPSSGFECNGAFVAYKAGS